MLYLWQMLLEKKATRTIELDFVRIEFYAPDLVLYHYKPQTHLTWPMLQQVAKEANELTGYKKCYMCSVIGEGLTIDKEARDNGTKPEIQAYTKAAAIVLNSLAHRIIANFIVKVQRPPVPTRSFNTLEDGLGWLNRLKIQEQ